MAYIMVSTVYHGVHHGVHHSMDSSIRSSNSSIVSVLFYYKPTSNYTSPNKYYDSEQVGCVRCKVTTGQQSFPLPYEFSLACVFIVSGFVYSGCLRTGLRQRPLPLYSC